MSEEGGSVLGANRLCEELSPYLQQHAHNPVDWYPWGDEALSRARDENRPILLSIGYSACHWCHVMERESFDDPDIAAQMNAAFVNIKVDREERPDLDKVYQDAVQLMTRRSGGWPLTVFLTPSLEPFYGGTYFPPEDRHGLPGFSSVIENVARAYREQGAEVARIAGDVIEALTTLDPDRPGAKVDERFVVASARKLAIRFDDRYGGFGDAPKFPNTLGLDVMLRAFWQGGDDAWLSRVQQAVDAMIDGGIHDQLGGGFHRYATDARWHVPHFEKMLYDNALIARTLVDLWRVTKDERYKRVCGSLLGYVEREMSAPEGGFYATQDADSEGREGAFFVWTPREFEAALGPDDAAVAGRYFGVDDAGNFEGGTSVLRRTRDVAALAKDRGTDRESTVEWLDAVCQKLLKFRNLRPRPFRDEKIIASWNGLMAGAFAEAGGAFGEARWLQRAERALSFVRDELWCDGFLRRVSKGGVHRGRAFLVDYADVANAALDLYEASFNASWVSFARTLMDAALGEFWDDAQAALYFAPASRDLVFRKEDNFDGEVPSASSSMLRALLRLDAWGADGPYRSVADRVLRRRASAVAENPAAYGQWIGVLDEWTRGPTHILVVEDDDAGSRGPLANTVRRSFVPNRMLTCTAGSLQQVLGEVPASPGAYICRNRTCTPPITDPELLQKALRRD
ncbi:MAG: thioredoxin domain-containing protein [Myxococcota bacterium]